MSEINQGAPAPEQVPVSPESQESQEQVVEGQESVEGSEGEAVEAQLDEAQKTLQDPAASKAEKKAAEKLIKRLEIKVDGKTETVELDLDNEEELKKHLQMSRAAQRRMQEARELQKAAEEFVQLLKTNPRKVLNDPNIGVDLKKLAQEIINEEIEESQKTPEQREKEKLQRELEELKAKFEREEKERQEREFQRLQAEQEEKIQNDIESALQTGELPKTAYTVRKMAEMMMLALQNDIDLSPKDLVPLLRKQMQADVKDLFGAASDDIIEELVGKERISAIRKKKVAQAQKQVAQTASAVKATGQDVKQAAKKEEKKISIRDFLKG